LLACFFGWPRVFSDPFARLETGLGEKQVRGGIPCAPTPISKKSRKKQLFAPHYLKEGTAAFYVAVN